MQKKNSFWFYGLPFNLAAIYLNNLSVHALIRHLPGEIKKRQAFFGLGHEDQNLLSLLNICRIFLCLPAWFHCDIIPNMIECCVQYYMYLSSILIITPLLPVILIRKPIVTIKYVIR